MTERTAINLLRTVSFNDNVGIMDEAVRIAINALESQIMAKTQAKSNSEVGDSKIKKDISLQKHNMIQLKEIIKRILESPRNIDQKIDRLIEVADLHAKNELEYYNRLEEKLRSTYGECDGLLEKVVDGLVKHDGVEFKKPFKSRLITDEDVDYWDKAKGSKERVVERIENEILEQLSDSGDDWFVAEQINKVIEIIKEELI